MLRDYQILTDSSCDLPQKLADQYGLAVVPLKFTIDDREYHNNLDGREIGFEEFYQNLHQGSHVKTSAANPADFIAAMEPFLQAGKDVLYIGFSSGLSTTFQCGCMAAAELQERYPEQNIRTLDSLCASLGQGLLVHLAVQKKREGMGLDELVSCLTELRMHVCHWFTVDDLMFLRRGGRIPMTAALLGTALHIKPVMHMDNSGRLAGVAKVRGRKAAVRALADRMEQLAVEPESQTVFICHAGCPDDAGSLAEQIRTRLAPREIIIHYVGPVIGAHSGPGTLSVFFLGTER